MGFPGCLVWLLRYRITCVYVILGGYMATAINDFIQGLVMLAGIVAVIAAVLNGQGGFLNAVRSLSAFESDVAVTSGQQGAFTSFFGPDPLNLLGVIILTSLGTWGLPQMIHKFYAVIFWVVLAGCLIRRRFIRKTAVLFLTRLFLPCFPHCRTCW